MKSESEILPIIGSELPTDIWTPSLSVLIRGQSFQLADSLLRTVSSSPGFLGSVASSALFDVCKDSCNNTYWKANLADALLKLGVSANVKNQKGETPLHLSCRNAIDSGDVDNVHHTIVQCLLLYGADCNIQDATEATCLELASELPDLEATLRKPIGINSIPLLIPWTAKSERFKPLLEQVARRQKSDKVEAYHFHKDPIGSGAFGFVYAGINSKDGREIAIKRIIAQRMIRPEDRREIESLIELQDCNQVLSYLGCTYDQHFVYIVLELMDGNLDEYLDSAPDPAHNVKLCKDVAIGIAFLHRIGILHRDLKPTNILYKAAPLCLKIADFGLSSKSDCCLMLTTVLHTNAGTRCWMAPELMKEKSVDKLKHTEPSDMFACGLVLHYILSGKKHPFSPDDCADKSPMEIQTDTESNILGFRPSISDCLSSEASYLVSEMIIENKDQRITATDSLSHPLFWSNNKKVKLIEAVGNQHEIGAPRSKATALSILETDLKSSFAPHFAVNGPWNSVVPMSQIYMEMTSSPKSRKRYDTKSCVELVRFIRNAYAHVSESHPTRFRTLLLEDFVFFDHFPWLVMAVYKAVMKAGWHQTREEVKAVFFIES